MKNTLRFSSETTDIYIAFYEIGLSMLNENGKLGYISPNTFLRNTSQKGFRDFLIDSGYISAIYDFKDTRIFDADIYTCVCILDKSYRGEYKVRYGDVLIPFNEFKERFKGSTWDLCSKVDMEFLCANAKLPLKLGKLALIQNGVTTQSNDVYVLNVYIDECCAIPYTGRHTDYGRIVFFKDSEGRVRAIESEMLRRCVKASRFDGEWNNTYILFPYKENEKQEKKVIPFSEEELKTCFPKAYDYLLSQKEKLLKRDRDTRTDWFCFGRSQGLSHIGTKRIVFKPVVRSDATRIETHILDEDIVVYGGYYILCFDGVDPETVCRIIASDDFVHYCKLKGKNMTGGYVSVGSNSVKQFGVSRSFF